LPKFLVLVQVTEVGDGFLVFVRVDVRVFPKMSIRDSSIVILETGRFYIRAARGIHELLPAASVVSLYEAISMACLTLRHQTRRKS
jgi:hypothetical protein